MVGREGRNSGADMEGTAVRHLEPDQITAYASGELQEAELFRLDEHLALCAECARRVRVFRFVAEHADSLLESWSARRASSAALQDRVAGVAEVAAADGDLQERLESWLGELSGRTRAVLAITVDGARRTAAIVDESLARLGRATGFQPVLAPVRVLGGGSEEGSASVEDHRHPWARVTADPATGVVAVQLARVAEPWPIAVLMPGPGESAKIGEFRPVEGEDYLLTMFEDVGDGEYTLLLEDTVVTSGDEG
jgi:anti-sigma factor RsiW